eukprot:COSAG01_NODE_4135_length_5315_cov_134.343750_5_plen_114_part_00
MRCAVRCAQDRHTLAFPGRQLELAKAVIAAQPHTVIVLVCAGAIDVTPLLELPSSASVSRPFPSWNRSILTEIYLCHACSGQEILRTETAGQVSIVWAGYGGELAGEAIADSE